MAVTVRLLPPDSLPLLCSSSIWKMAESSLDFPPPPPPPLLRLPAEPDIVDAAVDADVAVVVVKTKLLYLQKCLYLHKRNKFKGWLLTTVAK
jgi:hypothetical protein